MEIRHFILFSENFNCSSLRSMDVTPKQSPLPSQRSVGARQGNVAERDGLRPRAETTRRQSQPEPGARRRRASVEHVDLAEKTDFRALLRANMISQKEDFPAFDMLFDCFWRELSYERVPMETMEIEGTPTESHAPEGGDEEGGLEEAAAETLAQGKSAAGKFG